MSLTDSCLTPPHQSAQSTDWPQPDVDALSHSTKLGALIQSEIDQAGGWIPFDRYMELALYAPGLGYYAAGARKFGEAGDFITAPEVSPLFSRCLARQCERVFAELGGAMECELLEFGAGSGIMAAEVLRELQARNALPRRYLILEVSPELQRRQHQTLQEKVPALLDRVIWLEQLPQTPIRGCILANEVLDALPVKRFRRRDGESVEELGVGIAGDRLAWVGKPASEAFSQAVVGLEQERGGPFDPGYESELALSASAWVQSLSDSLAQGLVLLIDYGYERAEYYRPERHEGTLRCHYRHRAHNDPFVWPGLNDITAQVDFTSVAEAGLEAGLSFAGYTTQAYFLLATGLQEMALETSPDDPDPAEHYNRMKQIKALTLPGEMGERFKVLGLHRGLAQPLQGFMLHDLRDRL